MTKLSRFKSPIYLIRVIKSRIGLWGHGLDWPRSG